MTVENPTGDAGASITERIERFLSPEPQPAQEVEPQKADDYQPESVPETAEEQPASDESAESNEPQLSLSDLAKYLGVDESTLDVDDDGSVKVKTKIDGKEGAAKFQDLVKSYQLQGHVDAKAREAAEKDKALQERVQQFESYAQQEAQKLNQLAYIANQELMREVAEIDWQSLARSDPAEYVAKQAEFQTRQARVNQLMNAAQQQNSQWQQAQQVKQAQYLQSEAQRLTTLIPDWADQDKAKTEKAAIREYAIKQGFSVQEVDNLSRADTVALLRKAWLYDQGKGKAAVIEKQVRIAPKLVKPGQSLSASQRNEESVRGLKEQIRKSGGRQGISEYLMATGKV